MEDKNFRYSRRDKTFHIVGLQGISSHLHGSFMCLLGGGL